MWEVWDKEHKVAKMPDPSDTASLRIISWFGEVKRAITKFGQISVALVARRMKETR